MTTPTPHPGGQGPAYNGFAGPPTTDTWTAGQQCMDVNGVLWECTVSGTPGTWVQSGVPLAPVQRGLWAASTAYGIGDVVIAPTGDIVTAKAAFTSGGSYVAANWNILVPAQSPGVELAGAESSANAIFAQGVAFADVPGMSMTVPAGVAWTLDCFGQCASVQGSAAANTVARFQVKVVDSATATTIYAYAEIDFPFPNTGQTVWLPLAFKRRQTALGTATAVKMQALTIALTGLGNTGFFPAAAGGSPPTTMQAIGR